MSQAPSQGTACPPALQHSDGPVSLQEPEVAEQGAMCGIQTTSPNPQPQCSEGKTAAAGSELEGPAPPLNFLKITDT